MPEIKSESVKEEPTDPTHHSLTNVQPIFRPLPHLPKHHHFQHLLLPSIALNPKHARRAPPRELHINHLHPLPPPPAVKTRSFFPILKKARPGQPPLRSSTHQDPPATTTVPPPALAPSLLHPPPAKAHPPPQPAYRHTQVRIPRPHHNGHVMPFHFSHHILQHLNSNMDHRRTTATPAIPPCPAPPPAFPAHGIPSPPQPAPPALFPPLPPLPELPLTDQQANQLATAILRIARRAAAAAATNMMADNEL